MKRIVSVIGLGYVGLPVAAAFGRINQCIGFDIDPTRIRELLEGFDRTGELTPTELKASVGLALTTDATALRAANFHIVTVPTPIDESNRPDLGHLISASETVGRALKKGDIVVYESTVYPGATEEDCAPILERVSGLKCGVDFTLGYSPERINPGDKTHTLERTVKVVSGQDEATLNTVADVYGLIVKAGVYRAPTIKTAEAAKVIENTQRDLNIALVNELSMIFHKLGIDTKSVLDAAGTKWNFANFKPGLVGGHCIGVDPYYLTHKAEKCGYLPEVILAGRRINDGMGQWVAQQTIKQLIMAGHNVRGCTVTIMGLSFKENCRDLRNSKVVDIVNELKEYGVKVQVHDPLVSGPEAYAHYGIEISPLEKLQPASAVVFAVAHDQFRELELATIKKTMTPSPVLVDLKYLYDGDTARDAGFYYWRL